MAVEILMPQLGMYMVEGTLVQWCVPAGTNVKAGDEVLEIENDKAITVIVAPADGILEYVASEGEVVPVRGVLGRVLAVGEVQTSGGPAEIPGNLQTAAVAAPVAVPTSPGHTTGEIKATPLARTLAAQHGVDLTTLVGTGPGGRIGKEDVQAAIERQIVPALDLTPKVLRRVPISGRRKVIAQRMMASLDHTAQLTIMCEVDASALVAVRQALVARAEELGVRVSYDAILAKVLATALKEQPNLNAVIEEDEIVVFEDVNVGIATATPAGLVVPVVHGAASLSLEAVAHLIDELAARTANGKFLPDEMTGGTVTISNIGLFGIDTFTPILNPPESAILGVGRIASRPVVIDEELYIRPTVHLSLTWDHRVADGAEAAQLVGRVADLIADRNYLDSLA